MNKFKIWKLIAIISSVFSLYTLTDTIQREYIGRKYTTIDKQQTSVQVMINNLDDVLSLEKVCKKMGTI